MLAGKVRSSRGKSLADSVDARLSVCPVRSALFISLDFSDLIREAVESGQDRGTAGLLPPDLGIRGYFDYEKVLKWPSGARDLLPYGSAAKCSYAAVCEGLEKVFPDEENSSSRDPIFPPTSVKGE